MWITCGRREFLLSPGMVGGLRCMRSERRRFLRLRRGAGQLPCVQARRDAVGEASGSCRGLVATSGAREDRQGTCQWHMRGTVAPVARRKPPNDPVRLAGGASRKPRGSPVVPCVRNRGATAWAGAVTRLPGGEAGSETVQWTVSPPNARPVGGPGGRRGPICRGTNRAGVVDGFGRWRDEPRPTACVPC